MISQIELIKNKFCELAGHRWRYNDYSNFIKSNGDKYDFSASRCCLRCKKQGYFYDTWIEEEKSILDFDGEFHSTNQIVINSIIYS